MPDSLILNFRQNFEAVDFDALLEGMDVNEMVSSYESLSANLVQSTFPEKRITINEYDQP